MRGFKAKNVGDHIFVFDNKEEVEKIFLGEPWSFGKHLVALERYENNNPISALNFDIVSLWVQVHDIPIRFLNRGVAKDLCEAIGKVNKSMDNSEVEGGEFMQVRVEVDVNLPPCCGRVISLDEGSESWESFKYERSPNLCYWCGCLNHSNKDCELWINSNGSLSTEDQEYGPWIRAPANPIFKKNVIIVPGFYEARKKDKRKAVGQGGEPRPTHHTGESSRPPERDRSVERLFECNEF